MAGSSLQITYAEIRENIAMMLPISRTTGQWTSDMSSDVSRIMRSGLRKAYYPPPLGPGHPAHQWSFLRPWATLTTAIPYETGTITVVNGVVTLSGGTFPSTATYCWLVYGGKYYEVAVRDSGTQVTLTDTSSDNDSAAGTTYEMIQYRYALASNFESLEGPIYYHPDQSLENIPLQRRSDAFFRMLYQDSLADSAAQEPRFYALQPETTGGSAIQTWTILLGPAPTDVYHFKYRYNVQMNDLDGTDQYPPGGAQHSEMILEACLSEAEIKYNDTMDGPHSQKFRELLAASIQLDNTIREADTMGVVPINSPDYQRRSFAVTDPGYVFHDGNTLADYQT